MLWFILLVCVVALAVFHNKLPMRIVEIAWGAIGVSVALLLLAPIVPLLTLVAIAGSGLLYSYERCGLASTKAMAGIWESVGFGMIVAGIVSFIGFMLVPVTVEGFQRDGYIIYDLLPETIRASLMGLSLLAVTFIGVGAATHGDDLRRIPPALAK